MVAPSTGWTPGVGDHPWPPANVMVMHSFLPGCLDIRWDDPSTLITGPAEVTVQATGYFLISNNPLTLVNATGAINIVGSPIAVGDVIEVGGVQLTSVHAARTPGANDFNGSLATPALLAQEITNALIDANNSFTGIVSVSVLGSDITLTAVAEGFAGNTVTISSTSPLVGLTGPCLTGGQDADTLAIGSITLTAVAGARTSGSRDFSADGSIFDVAHSLTDAINDTANGFSGLATAMQSTSQVNLTAVPIGVLGNDVSIASNSWAIQVSGRTLSGGSGVDCGAKSNSNWNIVGVNVYRSDTGERGPYFRVNHIPVGTTFFRDCTSNVLVDGELVNWDSGWVSRGDAANNRLWRIQTRRRPIVKREGQAVPADSPTDVTVVIDGQVVPVEAVFGPSGQVDLINLPTYDPSTEKTIPPVLPAVDGSSVVQITYWRKGNLVKTDLETKAKIHYRLTTVAVDPNGITPSGLVETPLGYSPPVSPIQREQLDYMWREAIRRNRWILEQGGERVKLFIRRVTGIVCPCQWDPRLFEFAQQPLNNCDRCYGTGFLGGFEGPIDVIIAPDDSERSVQQTPVGRKLSHQYEVWTGPTPLLSQRDFIVKMNGERYSIGPVRRTQVRGVVLQQSFNIGFLDECDIRYKVPLTGLDRLPWPETRYTRPEEAPCVDSDPYPVGYDYQAQPMGTEVAKIPDGREQRGRTPVWSSIMYGGKGGS